MRGLEAGLVLKTKDGSSGTNAIIFSLNADGTVTVLTDFGNKLNFSIDRLFELYRISNIYTTFPDYPPEDLRDRVQVQIEMLERVLEEIKIKG